MAKTKKELGLDSMEVRNRMRMTDYLGDRLGQMPLNIMSGLVGAADLLLYREGWIGSRNGCDNASGCKDYRCIFRSSYG